MFKSRPPPTRFKRKKQTGPLDLSAKVAMTGRGAALEQNETNDENLNSNRNGIYGGNRSLASSLHQRRLFSSHTSRTARSATTRKSQRTSRRSRFPAPTPASVHQRFAPNAAAVHIVCCVSENLARESCVASMDAGSPTTLLVAKQSNGQTYAETLAYLQLLQPHEILLNEGRRTSPLARKILTLYPQETEEPLNDENHEASKDSSKEAPSTSTVIKFLSRLHFDQTKGAELLRNLAREETYDSMVVEEYILLASTHALLQYVQQQLGATLVRQSLSIDHAHGQERMRIDRATLLQLELLVNSQTGKFRESLVGTMDRTHTTVGSRLLRTNLMAPPTNVDTIHARLALVDVFLHDQDFFYETMDHLQALPDVDRMLSSLALIPQDHDKKKEFPQQLASKGISALVGIKSILSALPTMVHVIQTKLKALEPPPSPENAEDNEPPANDEATIATHRTSLRIGLGAGASTATQKSSLPSHHLLSAILFAMTQPALTQLHQAVSEILNETTTYSRNSLTMRHQECFALQSEPNGMLAVLRKAFLANVDEIYRKADEYAELYGLRVHVKHTTNRGFFLSVPSDAASDLPNIFQQPMITGRYIHCTTEDVTRLNCRAKDNVQDILLMTFTKIQNILDIGRDHYDAVAALSDAVALLDLCHGFAQHVVTRSSTEQKWSRPVVFDKGDHPREYETAHKQESDFDAMMMIRGGRYGIDAYDRDTGESIQSFVPNDTFVSNGKRFTMITGINGSGKSTYLKQIAICTVLAHCGSYVPAELAWIPVRDMLCSRIGNADDQEHNISTFLLEMKEIAYICSHATEKSLILIDELGRATSNEDGVSIAWSIAEHLLQKQSLTFFVTHYPQLSCLENVYPSVQNIHLEASLQKGQISEISYTHKVKEGSCAVCSDYGVELAAMCGWQQNVFERARMRQEQIASILPDKPICGGSQIVKAQETLKWLIKDLPKLTLDEGLQTFDAFRTRMCKIHEQYVRNVDADLTQPMSHFLAYKEVPTTQPNTAELENADDNQDSSSESSGSSSSTSSVSSTSV